MMHFPLNNVPDSVLWHYRVQVNIYAWILRKYYDINVTELRIVCLHPDNAPQPLIVNVPMMQDKIEKLMSWRRDDRHSQIHLSADARDLRGGSQEDGPSFSQMLEQLATELTLTDTEILQQWEYNRRVAAAAGTWMHAKCECLLNGGQVPSDSPEVCMFFKFLQDFHAEGWIFMRTEWTIYADAEDLAGSFDAVAQRGTDICLLDWKRTKQLASKDSSFGHFLQYPLQDIPDSVLWHYRVQLNMYAWILRNYDNVVVTDLRIVCLHPDNGFAALVIPVPLLSDCMAEFMTWRRNDLQSRIRLTGSQGSSDLTMLSDLRAGRQDKEGLRLPQVHADDLQPLRDDSVVESMMSTEWNRMHGLVDPAVRSMHLHGLHARTQMCEFLTSVNDLRGGSQDDGDSFSQMLEQQLEGALAIHQLRLLDISRQSSLLNDCLIKYYIAWCSLDIQPSGGFCTMDACFLFVPTGLTAVARKPANNIYVYLPHRMLDPVADEVRERLDLFWRTTYWGNLEAFEVFIASLTLALRGENVDRAFWGIGSGGVGQSPQTAHIEAILGEYHTCLDMNIYFVDEEMRKQPANLVGKIAAMIAAHRDEEKQAVQQIRQWLCEERKDWFTLNQLKTAKSKFVFNFNKQEVQNVIENMVKQGKMISAPITLPKVGQTTIFLPTYSCEKALGDVVPVKHDQNLVFTEEYNVERVCSRLAPTSSRSLNLKTLAQLYRKECKVLPRRRVLPKETRLLMSMM
ncbi:unnamed protein product [Symbiodinium microadriaticum]|nr:unnamed protein product [Symbiodinium microadriaticum]CAE7945827.1 unnamed protein product [Symbiodinium sp. KB8]